jgi:hypothetical protein
MKQKISRHYRRFDSEQRCWVIDPQGQCELDSWLSQMRRDLTADVVYKNQRPQSGQLRPPSLTGAYATLHLLPTAPPELVKAAYRCLAMINHPDVGGDTESMQQINVAYAQLSTKVA